METIHLEKLTKTYTSESTDIILDHKTKPAITRTVLHELTMDIPVGQLTVMLGRSGCGKSTLLRLLNGEEPLDSGEIQKPEGMRTALLKPDPYVITWTSVRQNIAMAGGAGRTPEERAEMADRLMKLVKLEEFSDLTPVALSTGMRQRLGLARVLAGQSKLLLMDEPFAALDFITREELQNELLAIQKKMPRTILLVTHQLEEALLLAQKIVVLYGDSSIREFDLSRLPYPRDLQSPQMQLLRQEITAACREKA